MKQLFILCLAFFFTTKFIVGQEEMQSLEQLRSMQANKVSKMSDLQAQLDALQGEVDAYQDDIDILSGWRKGVNGLFGFNINRSVGWVANPNPRASTTSLNIGLTGYANYDKDKFFFHNKGIITESWQDVDKSDADRDAENDGLLQNGVVDLFNISALAGYKISETFGFSGQAELNTSVFNFLSPGTFDIGLGATWLPMPNLTIMVHPLNYHVAFSGINGLKTAGTIGAKVRVDYYNDFDIAGYNLNWTSTLTSFVPYADKTQVIAFDPRIIDGESFTSGLFEYTWLNTLSFEVWKGIGVGLAWGLRKSDFEGEKFSDDELPDDCPDCLFSGPKVQSYFNFGLTYNF